MGSVSEGLRFIEERYALFKECVLFCDSFEFPTSDKLDHKRQSWYRKQDILDQNYQLLFWD